MVQVVQLIAAHAPIELGAQWLCGVDIAQRQVGIDVQKATSGDQLSSSRPPPTRYQVLLLRPRGFTEARCS